VIGMTNADGIGVAERAVTVQEFMATIYQAVGVDSNKRYKANADGVMIPIVEGKASQSRWSCRRKPWRRPVSQAGPAETGGSARRLPTELVEGKRTNSEIVDTLYTATLARCPPKRRRPSRRNICWPARIARRHAATCCGCW